MRSEFVPCLFCIAGEAIAPQPESEFKIFGKINYNQFNQPRPFFLQIHLCQMQPFR